MPHSGAAPMKGAHVTFEGSRGAVHGRSLSTAAMHVSDSASSIASPNTAAVGMAPFVGASGHRIPPHSHVSSCPLVRLCPTLSVIDAVVLSAAFLLA